LCDNVFRQADKLIVKPEMTNIVVKDATTFKIFLQNNMDRGIAEISLIAENPAFDFSITPAKMSIPKDQRAYFEVTMSPKSTTRTGNYTINFRLVGGGREFKSFNMSMDRSAAEQDAGRRPQANSSGEKKTNVFAVKRLVSSMKCDGQLDDQCWKSSAVASNFSSTRGGKALAQTVALIFANDNGFCFGFFCADETPDLVSANDSVEIRIADEPSGYPYYSFVLLANGGLICTKVTGKGSTRMPTEAIMFATAKTKKAWTGEIVIPYRTMDFRNPSGEQRWFLRIIRTKMTEPMELSYWSADSSGYNKEKGFGEFYITP